MALRGIGGVIIFGAAFFGAIFGIVLGVGAVVIFVNGMADSRDAWYLLLGHAARAGGCSAVAISLIALLPWSKKRS